ncbi:transglutaminase domain-containing protein [Pseudobutyrivibrio xylanivorans]|uniref:Transglutaminase-like superfamily protein n=1 Tax=Pseudobutyrivibrio xylanivorans DSM 14809 TaxID=1123012 RepID=A0A1M6KUI1_PSEXY|nr:transglutaminase domain-containing protein [Pseudobutyrivibrio xylanivorans]SHJ62658.1 Transglutaminase-like superfamily protein [Pseudobutyrivibrio xylanivorans DSM 14809]
MKRLLGFLFRTITTLVISAGIFAIVCYFLQNYSGKNNTKTNPMLDEPVVVESVSYDRYAYQHIDEESKITYDQIYNCITEYKEKITVTTKSSDVLQRAYEAVMSDYGNLFWVSGYKYNTYTSDGNVVSIEFSPKYTMSKEQKDVYNASVEATADEWLSGISENASDFDKALYVFETLIENVDYNTESKENQNILSVFLYRSTVCQGYADSAWYLLDKLGIKSTIITGTANGESHAWNLVYLDGAYYYMDVTWGNSKYMDGNNDTAKRVNYAYLAMTTEEISQNHVITVDFEVPECLSNADNYFVHEGLYYDWFGVDSIGNRLSQSYESGEAEISLKFSNSDLYSRVINYFIDENHLSDYCRGLSSVYYLLDENANVLTIQWTKGE